LFTVVWIEEIASVPPTENTTGPAADGTAVNKPIEIAAAPEAFIAKDCIGSSRIHRVDDVMAKLMPIGIIEA